MSESTLFVSAGDPSGDNAASSVISALRINRPNLKLFGLGGPRLKFLGQEQLASGSQLAVLGFWEVAKRFLFFRDLMKRTVREIEERRPDVILLVDYPGFNLRLAKRIRSFGISIIYYISPQVWAWAGKRVELIRRTVDMMLLILPFEKEFFVQSGVNCRYVGHYLLDEINSELISSPVPKSNQIALLPGSRPQEIERMLLPMLHAAELTKLSHGTTAVVAGVSGACDYESAIAAASVSNVTVIYDEPHRVISESEIIVTASGTATLECGVIGRPTIIIYKTGFITYHLAKRMIKLDKIGLLNLVLGKKIAPELIQNDASPENIATSIEKIMHDDSYRQNMIEQLRRIPDLLGSGGASLRAAQAIEEFM